MLMMATRRPKIENDPSDTIFAWWRDQPLGGHNLRQEMRAFDKLTAALRLVVNECALNVLPSTVLRSVKIWGELATLEAIQALSADNNSREVTTG